MSSSPWSRRGASGWTAFIDAKHYFTIRPVRGFQGTYYWLYFDRLRFSPTRKFNDSVMFTTLRDAKRYAESLSFDGVYPTETSKTPVHLNILRK